MIPNQAERLRREAPEIASGAALLLTAGGDERIWLDPATGRNRYATTATPRPDEVFFSSSTASTITPRAYRAAEAAWAALTAEPGERPMSVEAWFDSLRARLLSLFGVAGAGVVLAASGTDVELVALAIAKSVLPGPIANIVVAPRETGGGVLRAAAGAHFLDSTPFGAARRAGDPLRGWAGADIAAAAVEIRDSQGVLRAAAEIDAEARGLADAALAAGRNVLLHRLETSKTGRSGVTAQAAGEIAAGAPGRVLVLVDCCQLRCSRRAVRCYLESGFMVAITGSKFFGGPAFCGALLLPPQVLRRIGRLAPPAGLADYSSRLDWPGDLRERAGLAWANDANLGLALRWVAALEEMERFYALPGALRREALGYFERHVRERAQSVEAIHEIRDEASERAGILCFVMTHPDGAPFSAAETAAIHAKLRSPAGRIFHLGQPVAVGPRTALRVCASAPLISDVATRIKASKSVEKAFAQWDSDIDALFAKWLDLLI